MSANTKSFLKDISVVMPTLNCRYLIEPLAYEIRELCSSVSEVIIVDSHSEDSTVEFLQSALAGLNFRVISRPRGLYASWNEGIAACREKWIHIATAGDVIGTSELEYLHEVAVKTGADVVSGLPRFVNTEDEEIVDPAWPIVELFHRRGSEQIVEMSGTELVSFSLQHCRPEGKRKSWLGSSASNLYKASCLKERPFPTSVGHSGDVLWGLANSNAVTATFCAKRCGRFVSHKRDPSVASARNTEASQLYGEAWTAAKDWLLQQLDLRAVGGEARELFEQMLENQTKFAKYEVTIRGLRNELVDRKAYLRRVRERVPRGLRRLIFPVFDAKA